MNNTNIYEQVAKEVGLTPKQIKHLYTEYWRFIKNNIQQLPLKENITEEEFNKLNTNYNISSLGHLTCSYDRMINIKKWKNYERYHNSKS